MPDSAAIELIHSLLINTRDRPQEALPDSREEDQGIGCACPVSR